MTEKVPLIARGQPITAEYLNALARAVNSGQIVLPAAGAGGAAISSPSGSGSSPSSDVRTWTITAVTEVGGVADTLTMVDGLGSIWTITNLGDLCALCGGGGGGVTNYIMAVTIQEFWTWTLTSISTTNCVPSGNGYYITCEMRPTSLRRLVYWCQNGTHDAEIYRGSYIKLLNDGVAVTGWNWTSGGAPTRALYVDPNVPADIPSPSTCTVPVYATMSRFVLNSGALTCNCALYPSFQTALPTFDQLQILASDNATVIFDLDLSGSPCQDTVGSYTPALTPDGNPWVACGSTPYYVESSAPPPTCTPSDGYIEHLIGTNMTHSFTRSWILAAP